LCHQCEEVLLVLLELLGVGAYVGFQDLHSVSYEKSTHKNSEKPEIEK
jgi:hypothetical protein